MIHRIEELDTRLEADVLRDFRVLQQAEVEVVDTALTHRVDTRREGTDIGLQLARCVPLEGIRIEPAVDIRSAHCDLVAIVQNVAPIQQLPALRHIDALNLPSAEA